jgi:hypothetical protein
MLLWLLNMDQAGGTVVAPVAVKTTPVYFGITIINSTYADDDE